MQGFPIPLLPGQAPRTVSVGMSGSKQQSPPGPGWHRGLCKTLSVLASNVMIRMICAVTLEGLRWCEAGSGGGHMVLVVQQVGG